MSMIEKIRNRQGLLLVMIGLGMLGFLIPYDAVMALFGTGGNRAVGEVNGEEISGMEYQQSVQSRRALGFSGEQLQNEVWNDIVTSIVLDESYDALGLEMSDAEFQGLLFENGNSNYMNMAFYSNAQNKQYWQQQFAAMLETPQGKSNFMAYRRLIEQKRIKEKFDKLSVAGVYANSLEGAYDYETANRKASFNYVVKKYTDIPNDEVEVSDRDVRRYYDNHKNDAEYQQRAGRDLSFVRIPVKATSEDGAALEAELNTLKSSWSTAAEDDEAFLASQGLNVAPQLLDRAKVEADINEAEFFNVEAGTIVGPYQKGQNFRLAKVISFSQEPDSASCRHILLSADNPSDKAEMATLMARADSLKRVIQRGGDFEALAAEYSDDPGSKTKGGFYDFFTRGRMVKPFENFCFENKPGTLGAVETQFGVHLIEVMEHTEAKDKVSVIFIDKAIAPSDKTQRDAYGTASEFAINASNLEELQAAAKEAGYVMSTAKDVQSNASAITGLRSASEVVAWAYNAEVGEISNPILAEGSYIVAILETVKEKGVPPFENVEDAMRAGAIRKAKAEKYMELMSEGSLEDIASAIGSSVQMASNVALKFPTIRTVGTAAEPEVVGAALAFDAGTISSPIEGENGIWVISPVSVTEPTDKTDFLTEQTTLLSRARGGFEARLLAAMQEKAGLKDLR